MVPQPALSTQAARLDLGAWISRILWALALLLLAAHLIVYVVYAIGLMRFPFDYDQGEGFELVDTILFSQGEWPYRDNEVYPFYASNYPPLFHVILVPFVWVFGPAYWYGRLAGFLGTLITATAIGWAVQREGRHRAVPILAGLAFLASNYVYHVGPLFRQHMTMVMFETLSVVVLAHVTTITDTRRRRRTMIIGLALLLAAGYTKQLAVATVIAVFLFLFVRNPRRSVIWGVGFAAVAGGLFLWINWATGGEWWANIIAANVNTYFPSQFVGLFRQWVSLHHVLIALSALFVAYELYFARLSLYSIWWVAAVANTALSGKWGAGDSYFATAIAASCILSGIFLARTLRGAWTFTPTPITRRFAAVQRWGAAHTPQIVAGAGVLVPAIYLVYGLSVIHLPTEGAIFGPLADRLGLESSYGERYAFYDAAGWVEGYATIGHIPTQQDIDAGWEIVDRLRADPRPAMSEEAAFSLHADKDVVTNPTQLKNLYENDLFDPANLIAAIRAHDFSVIVFRAQFYPPPVLDAVYEAYYPDEVIEMNGFNYEIWQPGPDRAVRDAAAAWLADPAAGEALTHTLDLPGEQAQRWLAHLLARHGWERVGPLNQPGCTADAYQQAQITIRAALCPSDPGTALTLAQDAG